MSVYTGGATIAHCLRSATTNAKMTWDDTAIAAVPAGRAPRRRRARWWGRIASGRFRPPAEGIGLGRRVECFLLALVLLFVPGPPAHADTAPGTIIRNQAQIAYAVSGHAFTTGSNTDLITVQAPPIPFAAHLGITVSPATTRPGETLLMTIGIENTGALPLPAGQLAFLRPSGVNLIFPAGCSPTVIGGTVVVATPAIPVGGSLGLPIDVALGLDAPIGTMLFQADYTAATVHLTASQEVQVIARTSSALEALRYAPDRVVNSVTIPLTEYDTGGGSFAVFPPPPLPGGGLHVTDGPIPLVETAALHAGQVFFAQVEDPDQNRDPAVAETILVRAQVYLSDATPADAQNFRVTETAPGSGVFLGYLLTTGAGAVPFDGLLSAPAGSRIGLSYGDARDAGDTAVSGVLVDPFGTVFESATGQPIDGVRVTLIDADANTPASVFGDDGTSTFPATVVTGATVTDGGGQVYQLPTGGFRFPLVAPGHYRFELELPADAGFHWPSTVATAQLQTLPGAPFALDVGSRGEPFVVVDGPPVHLDVPIDPAGSPLWIGKSANKTEAAAGDFVQYRIAVESTRTIEPVGNVVLTDVLPSGFRYQPGSARIAGDAAPDPTIAGDGRTLQFHLGDLAPRATIAVTYVTQVGAAPPGDAVNRAAATGSGSAVSNAARAVVVIREDLFRSHTILVGRVADQELDAKDAEGGGIEGVRIFLEDGTYAVTDERGQFHFEALRPGTHVVQLDLDSLPEAFEVLPTERSTRDAGRAWSKFVDLQGGSMWRVDFPVTRKPARTGAVVLSLETTLDGDRTSEAFRLEMTGTGIPIRNARLTVVVPEHAQYDRESSRLDGTEIPDPEITSGALTYRFGDRPAGWRGVLTLTAHVDPTVHDGELVTRGFFTFETETGESRRTPVVENVLLTGRIADVREAREFTVRPQFDSLSTTLRDDDKTTLRKMVAEISGLENIRLQVVGHSDDKQIRFRSWGVFKDNLELSRGRAAAVASYLKDELGLSPASATILSRGDAEPVAANDTEEGRAQNRRVEVRVIADRAIPAPRTKEVLTARDTKSVDHSAPRPGEVSSRDGEKQVAPARDRSPARDDASARDSASARHGAQPLDADGPSAVGFDRVWIESARPGLEWLLPADGSRPRIPSADVGIKHGPKDRIELSLNGSPVAKQNFEKTIVNQTGTVAFSLWLGIDLVPGDNLFVAVVRGEGGIETGRLERTVHYPGPPVRVELVASRSTLSADGLTPPLLALRFFDRDGFPAREDATGGYRIAPPYRAKQLTPFDLAVMPGAPPETLRYTIGPEGIALIELTPTTDAGVVKLVVPLANGDHEVFATLRPAMRDWILVGLAEGTLSYETITGNMETQGSGAGPGASARENDLYEDGRVAFYAKGRVKGKWLATLAYDSDKPTGPRAGLYGTIDPGTYYTLYGDRSTQLYDAASGEKLYLKIERDRFYAMFGDFDTALTRSELSRYSRSLTGLHSRYADDRYEVIVFASDVRQAFVKDELRGEGITGPYQLSSRSIVLNSEKVRIQVRDRFKSEVVISERTLTRHFDYDVDYVLGTLIFREAVYATDASFNHVFIVADYESFDASDKALTYGGRAQAKIGDRLEVGLSHVTEGRAGGDVALNGADAELRLTPETTARAEIAHTSGDDRNGSAYLLEVDHKSAAGGARAYFRELGERFGLGQTNRSESGTRKSGVEASYRFDNLFSLRGQAFRQENLAVGGTQDVVETETVFQFDKGSAHAGVRGARNELPGADPRSSSLLTAGATRKFFGDKLDLLLERDQPIGGQAAAVNYPARTRVGADYRLGATTSVFVAQEWADGAERDTQNTLVGLKSTPWNGGELATSVTRAQASGGATDAATEAASLAVRQRWALGGGWSLDAGVERIETLGGDTAPSPNVNVPFASGATGDATAATLGVAYNPGPWLWTARLDVRDATLEERRGFATSLQTDPRADLSLLFGMQTFAHVSSRGEDSSTGNVRMGLAYRPARSRWIVLDRLDWIRDRRSGGLFELRDSRFVNNLNANHRAGRWQTSLQYGAKFAQETIDGVTYDGYTDLIGVETRFDLTPRWDLGLRASVLHAWSAGQLDAQYGLSLGHVLMKNIWLSVGYNFAGFDDRDFAGAEVRRRGPFLAFRVKFDQQSLRDALQWAGRPASGRAE